MTAELKSFADSYSEKNKDIIKSTGLLSSVVENILIQCIDSCSMDKLSLKIQRKFKLPNTFT